MQKLRLIIDLATNRVVYFTTDLEEKLHTDEYTAIAEHTGEFPQDMTLRNSFNFVYINKGFKNTAKNLEPISALEQNRTSIRKMINDRIEEKYVQKFPSKIYYAEVENFKTQDAKKIISNELISSDWLKHTMQEKNFSTMKETANFILDENHKYQTWLLNAETLRLNFIKSVDSATTSDQLFELRDNLFKELDKI